MSKTAGEHLVTYEDKDTGEVFNFTFQTVLEACSFCAGVSFVNDSALCQLTDWPEDSNTFLDSYKL